MNDWILLVALGLCLILLLVFQARQNRKPENRARRERNRQAYLDFLDRRRRELQEHGSWWSRLRFRCGTAMRQDLQFVNSWKQGLKLFVKRVIVLLPYFFGFFLFMAPLFAVEKQWPLSMTACILLQIIGIPIVWLGLLLVAPDREERSF